METLVMYRVQRCPSPFLKWLGKVRLFYIQWCCECHPQIYKGDPRPHISPYVMAASAIQIGGLWVYADHTRESKRKANASTIFECCEAFYECLSSRLDCSRYRWHIRFGGTRNSETYRNFTDVSFIRSLANVMGWYGKNKVSQSYQIKHSTHEVG